MKKLTALLLVLLCIFLLGSCNLLNLTAKDYQKDGEAPARSKYLIEEDGKKLLALPETGKKVEFDEEDTVYCDQIKDDLVIEAERYILGELTEAEKENPHFYFRVEEGKLCLAAEVIRDLEPIITEDGREIEDHEHVFFYKEIIE